ncbi:MAG: ATP-dependent DNA ligase [Patescibacteria group bacterium]|nr:ATP-dependent DNA ligase [Patescibacteria group bacterium]
MARKSGGRFTAADVRNFHVAQLANPDVPVFYAAHSIAELDGQNLLRESNAVRWRELRRLFSNGAHFAEDGARIVLAESGNGGEFFEAVIAAGGEGVCAVNADSPWGLIYAAKKMLEVKCRVTGKDIATGCLSISDIETLAPLGKVPCRAQFDRVNVGDIIEVECLERHKSGLLREARFTAIRKETK